MATTTDRSVLTNLNQLFEMETDRRVEEATAKERAKLAEAARLDAERGEREAAIERARAEERQRAEAARAEHQDALDLRIQALKDELAQVRTQREETRLAILARSAEPQSPSRAGNWIVGSMAAVSLVAALTATVLAWPAVPPPVAVAPPPAPVVEVVELPTEPPLEVATEPAPEAVAVAEPVATSARPRPSRPRAERPRAERPRPDRLSQDLDFEGGDEVLSDRFLRESGN